MFCNCHLLTRDSMGVPRHFLGGDKYPLRMPMRNSIIISK